MSPELPVLDPEWLDFVEEERSVDPGLVPDATLPLKKSQYKTKEQADARFAEIQAKHSYILIGTEETAAYWVYFVLHRRS